MSDSKEEGLTDSEKIILKYTAMIWNEYTQLDSIHPDEFEELRHKIHEIQYLIARRVARRVNPEVWA